MNFPLVSGRVKGLAFRGPRPIILQVEDFHRREPGFACRASRFVVSIEDFSGTVRLFRCRTSCCSPRDAAAAHFEPRYRRLLEERWPATGSSPMGLLAPAGKNLRRPAGVQSHGLPGTHHHVHARRRHLQPALLWCPAVRLIRELCGEQTVMRGGRRALRGHFSVLEIPLSVVRSSFARRFSGHCPCCRKPRTGWINSWPPTCRLGVLTDVISSQARHRHAQESRPAGPSETSIAGRNC